MVQNVNINALMSLYQPVLISTPVSAIEKTLLCWFWFWINLIFLTKQQACLFCDVLMFSHLPSGTATCRAFLITLNELNDYAGQHEVIAENLSTQIIAELSRYTQELKAERKSVRTCLFHTFIIMTITKNSCSQLSRDHLKRLSSEKKYQIPQ